MKRWALTSGEPDARQTAVIRLTISLAMMGVLTSGCIQVRAPEKPIEINLNVNVRQEVVVKLQKDAEDLIENNPELFPQ